MRGALLCLVLSACTPITRVGLKRCPALPPMLADFIAASVAMGVSVDAYTKGDNQTAAISASVAMGIGLAAAVSECK